MDDVGGVADQREPFGDERARHRKAERIRAARPDHLDVAELAGRSGVPARRGIRRPAARRCARPRASSSVQTMRRAVAGQRQDRERPGRQEMLFGAAVMIALVRHGGDDAGLIVVPADAADAGALADRRARAIGGDQKLRRDASPSGGQLDVDALRVRLRSRSPRSARSSTPSALARSTSASTSAGFSTIWANGSPGATSPPNVRNIGRTRPAAWSR